MATDEQRVKKIVEDLISFPPDWEVRISTGPKHEWEILSIYGSPKKRIVWIDVAKIKGGK